MRFAGFSPDAENCCRSAVVTSSTGVGEVPSKDEWLNARWGRSEQTCCDRSGVEMMNFDPETLRQWMKVSSVNSVRDRS